MINNKKCLKCFEIKEVSNFRVNRNVCKKCNISNDSLINKNKHDSNELLRQKRKDYLKEYRRKQLITDPEYYKKENIKKREYRRNYIKNRIKIDINFRITKNIRTRIYSAIKGFKKYNTHKLTGCSINELKKHLEEKFQDNMSWSNYGKWHIDHIMPCISFNMSNIDEQIKCFHYTNLQPLWAIDNLKKGATIKYKSVQSPSESTEDTRIDS